MKANAGTNTDFGIDNYRIKKISSLKSLFMPYYRFQLLFEKTIMSNNNNSNVYNSNKKIDFSNKSIFVYHYNNRKLFKTDNKKSLSLKKINFNKSGIKIKTKSPSKERHLSINNTINSYTNQKKEPNKIDTKTYFKKLSIKNFTKYKNNNINLKHFPKTTGKKKLFLYSSKKKNNFFDIKKKLDFNNNRKKSSGRRNTKSQLINIINDKKMNHFLSNQKEKTYKLKQAIYK